MRLSLDRQHILDFDIECRPLSWYGGDFVSKEITAIAWAWIEPKPKIYSLLLGDVSHREMVTQFFDYYHAADIVTGHYIRGFDLPLFNAEAVAEGLGPLKPKMTQDTKLDLTKRHGRSGSLENLAASFGLFEKKSMTESEWREANRLTEEGRLLTAQRVEHDVSLHIRLRSKLLEQGLLRSPVLWTPESSGKGGRYVP